MAYCVNPACPNPENLVNTNLCQACGNKLLLQDKYEVIHTLGQGGFGATFIAKNVGLPGAPQCVIKQLRPNSTAASVMEMARDLFRREAKTLGKIGSHPQIPTLLDYFEQGNEFYLVQEFISGLTLQQEVKDNGPFTEAGVRQFLSEILPLIQYIHSQQVIHRDIKPANIIRRNQDRKLVLIDFGAVKDQVNPNVASLSEQTALTSYAIGTPGYAPPEQMAMRPVYSSDIYALGVTCLYLLTSKSPKDLNYNPATGEMNWLSMVDISDSFASVIIKMLEVSVKHRYQTANEVLKALDMEPYLESLAQSMIKPTTNVPDKTTGQAKDATRWQGPGAGFGEGGGRSSRSASAARMAESIRSRRNRAPGDTTQVFTGNTARPRRSPSAANSGNTQIAKDKGRKTAGERVVPPKRLTPAQVQQTYAKGNLDFTSHDLSNQDFQRFNLAGANLHSTRLEGANLCNADLSEANLGRTNLSKAALRDAKLVRAYMNYTDLIGADLRGADLSYAHMSNANLLGANLSGANLTGAKVNEDQLALAKVSWNTVMPNGKRNGLW
ncbi:MAG: protein kinase domain-containing protein [Prochlorotrichaceae cyanobacterium]